MITTPYPDPAMRWLITVSVMMATVMDVMDGSIANVALPHMQASMFASPEQIVWVLTSYLISTAIATPLSGWLANRFGRKRVMVFSLAGFTLASIACGFATDLYGLVLFRVLQGACGAGLVPLSQALMLDINPPERHGQAMAIYGMGVILGPVIGPTLGGWLTDEFTWRWCFLINAPIGLAAVLGIMAFVPESRIEKPGRFDFTGFAALSIFLASLQLIMDRGQQLDWFSSWEIRVETLVAAVFGYAAIVHMFTAKEPFIRPAIFRDRNFLFGSLISALLGLLVFAVIPLITVMVQQLMQYPVMLTGMLSAPRGLGTMVAMLVVGQFIGKIDGRYPIFLGLVLSAAAMYQLSHTNLYIDQWVVISAGILQGLGAGLIFVPLSVLIFATLDPPYRNEGATLFALTRNVGAAVGISFLQTMTIRNAAIVQSRLTEWVRPDNPVLGMRVPDFDFAAPTSVAGMEHDIVRQAMMVGYVDSYWFLLVLTFAMIPIALLMRTRKSDAIPQELSAHM